MAMRLDQYLVSHHAITRNKARQLIESDLISVDGRICSKVSAPITGDRSVTIADDRRVGWVSRSAEKLAGYLEGHPDSIIKSKNCLDVGSSTGGFTQVLLELGATHVDAVDVGTDQLHPSLRADARITSYEQTDIRDFAQTKRNYDIIVCDASFISLTQILDALLSLASRETLLILLYKPQFEVGREHLSKHGVPKHLDRVAKKMEEFEILLQSKSIHIIKKEKSSLK
jgi:23S rRNA (cytidine1920-2'-O)/16S rRNA (cytidine1409-2'-O)-methyltransferase